jgi:hypothetical protein
MTTTTKWDTTSATTEIEEPKPAPPAYYRRTTCRICKSENITEFLSFGPMPLANSFRTEADLKNPEPRFNLSAAYCKSCGLVQVPDIVSPEILFKSYTYFSSASKPMVDHFHSVAEDIREQYISDPSDLICEIGSNDGVFLQNFVGKCRVIGVDPADNIATTAALKGVTTVNKFFNPRTGKAVRALFGMPKVVFAANCFAHIDEIDGIMEGLVTMLAEDGVFIFENHRFVDMLRSKCFDQIYHEHLAYYTLRPLEHLMDRYGLHIIDARTIPTHGESFQIHAARKGSNYPVLSSVERIRKEEDQMGLNDPKTYHAFAKEVVGFKTNLLRLLKDLKAQGKRIVGYGAPGKGTTLLNYCGIGPETLDYIIDSTPIKQGRYMPGTPIQIRHPDALKTDSPDYLLLLAWNYADAILKREQLLRDRGMKFILPVPKLEIV